MRSQAQINAHWSDNADCYNDKEKLLFGNTPMFMIKCKKALMTAPVFEGRHGSCYLSVLYFFVKTSQTKTIRYKCLDTLVTKKDNNIMR